MDAMKSKQIKVQYASRVSSSGCYAQSRYTIYPKIQMEGKWLETLGFHVGDTVRVDYSEGEIHIWIQPANKPLQAESVKEVR